MQNIFNSLNKLDLGENYWNELSSGQTPKEFKSWATKHSNQIKKALQEVGFTSFEKVSKNHFYYSLFAYSEDIGWAYVSVQDVRSPLTKLMIRTAKDNKDFNGGRNHWVSLTNADSFESDLRKFVGIYRGDHC